MHEIVQRIHSMFSSDAFGVSSRYSRNKKTIHLLHSSLGTNMAKKREVRMDGPRFS